MTTLLGNDYLAWFTSGAAGPLAVLKGQGSYAETRSQPEIDTSSKDTTGYALKTRGWYPGAQMLDGMFLTVGDRLLVVAGNTAIAGADGRLTIAVEPLIPGKLVDGAPVEANLPYAVLQMADTKAGYTVGVGQMYSVAFQAEEA
ncbi:hypothetical protein [uncultured Sphingomonas sp.]|uniref:hypothetical protein n=1 Tax=uncultured Sphingomonas sp. TaxID=158754 RepID=UPI002617835B|nr:hypothetical protein [uncultured Sphingomonas sp.]